jgi:DNA repair exonuclease SbcCD ATPase subunit
MSGKRPGQEQLIGKSEKTNYSNLSSIDRVFIKYPEFRESRELEFLYFKNLEIKVKNHDFEIKKIEEEENIIELHEESYEISDNGLKRIVKRVKMNRGKIMEIDVDEIKDTIFFVNEAEKVGENVNKLSDAELKNKVGILSDRIPLVGIEKEIKRADVKDAYLLLEKISVLKNYSKECDEISERIADVEKYTEEREKIKKEIEELEKEKKEKEGEAKIVAKEKAEAIKEEIKEIEKRIKEGKIRIKEIEEKRKEEAKKAKETLKELAEKIKKELKEREEKIFKLNDAIEKIKKLVETGKKKEEILEEIKDPYVKSVIDKVKQLEIDDILRELKRIMNSLRDPTLERVLITIEGGDMTSAKKYVEEMKKVVKSVEKLEEKLKSKDEIEIRKCIREISEELPNEYKEIVERIKEYLDELLKKKGKISEEEYRKERDKCFLNIYYEFTKLSNIKEIYNEILEKIEKIKKKKGMEQKIIDIIQSVLSKLRGERRKIKEIKRCNRELIELYEKEKKFLQISDELCAYIKSGKREDLEKLLKEHGEFEVEGIEIKELVSKSKMDPEIFKREVRSLFDKINSKIKSIEEKKVSLVKGTSLSKYFGGS